jgi:hypothetical protein
VKYNVHVEVNSVILPWNYKKGYQKWETSLDLRWDVAKFGLAGKLFYIDSWTL